MFFSLLCSLRLRRGGKKTFVGYLSRDGGLMLDHTTMYLFVVIVLLFLGRVLSGIMLP